MRRYVRTLPDFTTAVQSRNETTQKLVERIVYVSTSAENGPAMAGPAGPVPAPMLKLLSGEIISELLRDDSGAAGLFANKVFICRVINAPHAWD